MGGVRGTNHCLAASRESDTGRPKRRAFYARWRVRDVRLRAMAVSSSRAERRVYVALTDLCEEDGCFEVTRASFPPALRELANQ